ncbi:hypothetical protein [Brevifollis gellanilyticus]|uniref:Uncharacterized protein n=1 Tax=Brevifollis gellanilyticus TaxID=748831 RepID=A0A512M2B4_9BACT|nr:hypothetical protein [Brevifollis gellanilyticus]GEP40879.1 hypothetical protein BGE01nite_01700 [Brevifollis gellanilyticus]
MLLLILVVIGGVFGWMLSRPQSFLKPVSESLAKEGAARNETVNTQPSPVFGTPTDPKLVSLRHHLLRPWTEVKTEVDAFRQQTAMVDLSEMRTVEATTVMAELLFADTKTFFDTKVMANGLKSKTTSYSVMIYLYKILEGAPMPLDGFNYGNADLPVWQEWWGLNHEKLRFRELGKPAPLPSGSLPEGSKK